MGGSDVKGWSAFFEDWLGSSWRTSIYGLLGLILGIGMGVIGAAMTRWEPLKEMGALLIAQGISILVIAIGLMKARDHAASERRAQQLGARIDTASETAREDAIAQAKETILPEAKAEARQVAAAEVRESDRRSRN